jgi:hypothetical protein
MRSFLARRAVLSAALLIVWGQVTAAAPAETAKQSRTLCAVQAPNGAWDPFARFLAGMNSDPYSPALTPEQRAAWKDYSRIAGADWNGLQKRYLDHIEAWRSRYLNAVPSPQAGFYPFSGPDSADMLAFFPDARQYVMIGLEPVGCLPSGLEDYTGDYFTDLRHSLEPVVAMGFFRTNDMSRQFSGETVNGVLPLMLFLMARGGFTVVSVTPIAINAAGQIAPDSSPSVAPNQPKIETHGVAIQFSDARHGVRTLQYFSLNLQDSRLKKRPGTMKYMQGLPEMGTLVKSASYLMHKEYFAGIRSLILSKSRTVVEDDSGIPLHFFDRTAWDVRLYGSYSEPIALFKNWHQEDLKEAFSSGGGVQPLDFAIGYRKLSQSNLLLAFKRK